MSDLTQEEREALLRTRDENESLIWDETAPSDDADFIVWSVERFLAAVPRLREVEGMGFYGERWHVLHPNGTMSDWLDRFTAEECAAALNQEIGPGHHAVRLGVVEVATPDTEGGQDA